MYVHNKLAEFRISKSYLTVFLCLKKITFNNVHVKFRYIFTSLTQDLNLHGLEERFTILQIILHGQYLGQSL